MAIDPEMHPNNVNAGSPALVGGDKVADILIRMRVCLEELDALHFWRVAAHLAHAIHELERQAPAKSDASGSAGSASSPPSQD